MIAAIADLETDGRLYVSQLQPISETTPTSDCRSEQSEIAQIISKVHF
jgi:hypothetical protein